jgi:hypothetical protein
VKTKITLLFLILVLGACTTSIPTLQTLPAPTAAETVSTPPSPKIVTTVRTPHIDPGPDGEFPDTTQVPPTSQCGYQWAYQDLPELSIQFDQAIKAIIPNSTSHATAFGENCVTADGQVVRFVAMETDFYVIAVVDSLDDHVTFGNWIAKVMQTINNFPPDQLAGPNPGFVEYRFEKSGAEFINIRVPIQQYNDTANGKTGEELFQMFHAE